MGLRVGERWRRGLRWGEILRRSDPVKGSFSLDLYSKEVRLDVSESVFTVEGGETAEEGSLFTLVYSPGFSLMLRDEAD